MKKTGNLQKKSLVILLLVVIAAVAVYFFIEKGSSNSEEPSTDLKVSIEETEEETLIYLGDGEAENEMIFLFDYSCPYCYEWMNEVFPIVYEKWIETGEMKFRTQSLVLLSELSLQLSKVDQNIRDHYPKLYFDLFLANDDIHAIDDWLEDIMDFDATLLEQDLDVDPLSVTRKYVRNFEVEYVPTVVINGEKIEDSFSIEMLEQAIMEK